MPYILYPLILCVIPLHSLYAQNLSEISRDNYFNVLGVIELILVLGYGLLYLITQDFGVAALLLCLNFFLLFYANYFFVGLFTPYKRIQNIYKKVYSISYIFLCGLLSLVLYFVCRHFNLIILNKIMFYSSITLLLFIFLDIFQKISISKEAISFHDINNKVDVQKDSLPDIYHILLDSHTGFAHEEYCDNTFKNALIDRGFDIYENFMSNYPLTHLSVTSMFNMTYIHNLLKNQNYFPSTITYPLYANNLVFKQLKNKGYECNIYMDRLLQNVFFRHNIKMRRLSENQLLKLVIYHSIIKSAAYTYIRTNDGSERFKELLDAFIEDEVNDSPQYRFMHTLAPHSPYYYDENGAKLDSAKFHDDSNYFSYMKYIDKNIVELIDKIKFKMKDNSIILIQGDHGLLHTKTSWNVLCAVYFPNAKDKGCIPKNGTLVNLFRYLFNRLYSSDYEILGDSFYNHIGNPLAEKPNSDVLERSTNNE